MADNRGPLAEYLRARRARLQPEDVGLPSSAGRKVPGLRREEVASLAGISPDYYLRIEQGRDNSPSDQVLVAIARALRLDDSERRYMFRLARPHPHALRVATHPVAPGVLALLDNWSHTPAYLFDRNLDILAANQLMVDVAPGIVEPGTNLVLTTAAQYSAALARPEPPAVLERWDHTFREMIAALRYYSNPDDPRLQEILGALSLEHQTFRAVWALHEARPYASGANRAWIEPLGWVDFRWQALELSTAPGQYIVTHLAEPGSRARAAIDYLVSNRASNPEDAPQPDLCAD